MKFHFNLERLLTHRKTIEDLARKDYVEALVHYQEQKTILEGYYQSIEDARKTAFDRQSQGGNQAESLSQIHLFIKGTEIKIERQRKKVREFLEIVEDKQEILRQAAVEYKMIERLKEKKKEEFKLEERKREQKFTDELVTTRFRRDKER